MVPRPELLESPRTLQVANSDSGNPSLYSSSNFYIQLEPNDLDPDYRHIIGVENQHVYESEPEPEPNIIGWIFSDDENACELTGDKLERNLGILRSRLLIQPDEQRFTAPRLGLEKVLEAKTGMEWKKKKQNGEILGT